MKCFIIGIFGALLIIILSGLAYSSYSDYQARAETEGIIIGLETLKNSIEADIIKKTPLIGIKVDVNKLINKKHIAFLYVTNTGEIIVKGKHSGQLFILLPSLIGNNKVAWTCVGGSSKDMPKVCLNSSEKINRLNMNKSM